jgi:hypothetical protein
MGRFMSPDWSAKQEPVPYAKLDNPQSLNLYAYVLNNPLDKTDPDGHDFWDKVLNKLQGKGWVDTPRPQLPAKDASPTVPSSSLHTDMKGQKTTFKSTNIYGQTTTKTIDTKNTVTKSSEPGAGGPFNEPNIVGVSNRHAGEDAYGPAGAFIDVGDTARGREIHGGGTGAPDPMADQQGWVPTTGCTRGQNADVISLGQTITNSQHDPAESGIIPYSRNDNPQ